MADASCFHNLKVGGIPRQLAEGLSARVFPGEHLMLSVVEISPGSVSPVHSHPNEQWIYILEGTFQATVDGKDVTAKAGSVLYIPSNAVHSGKATPDADVVFFTVKDASHSLHGIKAA